MAKPLVLTIIDGLGISRKKEGNAFEEANTPYLDTLFQNFPYMEIAAAGTSVGLPDGQMGNSEVGHLNIGAGTVVYTGLSLITKSIEDKSFFENKALLKAIKHSKENKSTVHVMGLFSQGGVHSVQSHLFTTLEMLYKNDVKHVMVHIFGDGRDVAPRTIQEDLKTLIKILDAYKFKLATICGRVFAMDRDEKFDKTEEAFKMLRGVAKNNFTNPFEYIQSQYSKGINDEFIECAVSMEKGIRFLQDNDSVIFFNFRPDRARQLSHMMVGSKLYGHLNPDKPKNLKLVTMMKYEGIDNCEVAFDSMDIKKPLGQVVSEAGLKQLRIAETQKYAHVTFFMDGGKDVQIEGADRILIPSSKTDDFSKVPEMSAREITDALIPVMKKYDLVIMNYANPDMVGHTGDLKATVKALEILDEQIGRVYTEVKNLGGTMIITADHGNCEIMLDEEGEPATKHTSSPVPFVVTNKKARLIPMGSLANIAPTILFLLGIQKPKTMDKESLIVQID